MADTALLDIRDLHKSYGETPALRGVSLSITAGAIVCLLGPSGCGKTTLLRVIAGLEQADSGAINFEGRPIDGLPVHARGFGLMFQDYALFPHRDVAANVAFGLRMRGESHEQIDARVAEMLDLVGLAGYNRRRVYDLSGGERQRVALARSLAPSPRLLMLDEPLGALDRTLRERLLDELRAILKRVGVTSLYVTHDQAEAFAIADWLVLMNDGQIEQQGPPEAIYHQPTTRFAARFLGLSNLIDGRVIACEQNMLLIETPLGSLRTTGDAQPGKAVTLVIRPEAAQLTPTATCNGTNTITGVVAERSFRGSRTRLAIQHSSGQTLTFELDDLALPLIGERIALALRTGIDQPDTGVANVQRYDMHILQIYKDYFPVLGGIENHVRELSEALAARGHHVTVLVTSLDRRTTIEQPQPGLTVIKAARSMHLASTPLSLAMLKIARSLRPDLVHLHFPYPPGDLAALALPRRTPLVVTYHSDIVRQRALLQAYRPLLELTLRRAARILPTSPNYLVSSPFLRRHAARCAVAPLGIDADRFARADPRRVAAIRARYDAPLALFVGRLRYYKGLHVLLDAMPSVRGELLIGGGGPERERLERQAMQLGIAERVHFLGDIPDDELPTLFHAADVFVMPAHLRAEALGLAQIEALASGLPCISTELGTGTSFVNRHGETGLVVSPADAPALAAALNTLLANPDLRQRFGAAGRRRVAALFTRAQMVGSVEAIYRDVLTAR